MTVNFRGHPITEWVFQCLLSGQDYRCAICHEEAPEDKTLVVDHCHKTGVVRGLLCSGCDYTGLGFFGIGRMLLQAAVRYIENNLSDAAKRKLASWKEMDAEYERAHQEKLTREADKAAP